MNTHDKELGVCIFCDFPVYRIQETFNFAIDRPIRIDLIVHRSCYRQHRDDGDIKIFLKENLLDYLEKYFEEENVKTKKTHKTTRS